MLFIVCVIAVFFVIFGLISHAVEAQAATDYNDYQKRLALLRKVEEEQRQLATARTQVMNAFALVSARTKAEALAERHQRTLARKRNEIVLKDDYGTEEIWPWEQEVAYFARQVVFPQLTQRERAAVQATNFRPVIYGITEAAVTRFNAGLDCRDRPGNDDGGGFGVQ